VTAIQDIITNGQELRNNIIPNTLPVHQHFSFH